MSKNDRVKRLIDLADQAAKIVAAQISAVNSTLSGENIIRSCLMMRVMDLHSGVTGCVRSGSGISALVVYRALLESYVLLKGACEKDKFIEGYLHKHAVSKERRIQKLEEDFLELGFEISQEELAVIREQTRSLRYPEVSGKLEVYKIFRDVHELPMYHSQYAHCSLYTHTDAHSLEQYVDVSKDPTDLSYDLHSASDSFMALSWSADRLIKSMDIYLRYFGKTFEVDSSFKEQFLKLHG